MKYEAGLKFRLPRMHMGQLYVIPDAEIHRTQYT